MIIGSKVLKVHNEIYVSHGAFLFRNGKTKKSILVYIIHVIILSYLTNKTALPFLLFITF